MGIVRFFDSTSVHAEDWHAGGLLGADWPNGAPMGGFADGEEDQSQQSGSIQPAGNQGSCPGISVHERASNDALMNHVAQFSDGCDEIYQVPSERGRKIEDRMGVIVLDGGGAK